MQTDKKEYPQLQNIDFSNVDLTELRSTILETKKNYKLEEHLDEDGHVDDPFLLHVILFLEHVENALIYTFAYVDDGVQLTKRETIFMFLLKTDYAPMFSRQVKYNEDDNITFLNGFTKY